MSLIDDGVVNFSEDPFTRETVEHPEPIQARLREAGEVLWLEKYDCYAVTRQAQVRAVTLDWENFSSASGTGIRNYTKQKPWRPPAIVLEADPPLHVRGRAVFTRALSPGRVKALREPFFAEAEKVVDRALEKGDVDIVKDIAQAFTLKVFPDAVGMPAADRERFLEYGEMQVHSFVPPHWLDHDPYANVAEVDQWVQANCKRDVIVGDGFGAVIYAAVDAGEITEPEAQNLVRSFLSAGVDNSITSFANAIWCFAQFSDQWTKLQANPGMVRNAYEESLRYLGPLKFNFRTTSREVTLGDAHLRANEKVCVWLACANRDPRHWNDPEKFDIERKVQGHMAFGVGIHGCVGQVLARLEAEALLAALVKKVKKIEITGEPTRRYVNVVQGFASMPARLTPH
jgi:hypothetical protein